MVTKTPLQKQDLDDNTAGDSTPRTVLLFSMVIALLVVLSLHAAAQNPAVEQKVAEIKQAAAQNKEALAHYTWQQQQTTAIKGNVKDTKLFQVRIGPDGKPQKSELENMAASSGGGGPLKRHIVQKKKEEYEDYGEQIGLLAQEYAQPDPETLQQAYRQGNVMLGSAGVPGEVKIVISNYFKPGDRVTMVFNQQAKVIQSLDVATYLSDPSDAVNIGAQFSQLPDGTNHVSTMQVNGVSKELLVTMQNSDYQKIM
jgi:hypothetical protein